MELDSSLNRMAAVDRPDPLQIMLHPAWLFNSARPHIHYFLEYSIRYPSRLRRIINNRARTLFIVMMRNASLTRCYKSF